MVTILGSPSRRPRSTPQVKGGTPLSVRVVRWSESSSARACVQSPILTPDGTDLRTIPSASIDPFRPNRDKHTIFCTSEAPKARYPRRQVGARDGPLPCVTLPRRYGPPPLPGTVPPASLGPFRPATEAPAAPLQEPRGALPRAQEQAQEWALEQERDSSLRIIRPPSADPVQKRKSCGIRVRSDAPRAHGRGPAELPCLVDGFTPATRSASVSRIQTGWSRNQERSTPSHRSARPSFQQCASDQPGPPEIPVLSPAAPLGFCASTRRAMPATETSQTGPRCVCGRATQRAIAGGGPYS